MSGVGTGYRKGAGKEHPTTNWWKRAQPRLYYLILVSRRREVTHAEGGGQWSDMSLGSSEARD